jgi:gamma-glutamyl hercynylcysteine S-oxide synthase
MIEDMNLSAIDPGLLLDRYLRLRLRTEELFSIPGDDAFDDRPIPLRHPLRFYEGHLASFNANQLHAAGLLPSPPSPQFGKLFARGIDPDDASAADEARIDRWPAREAVKAYAEAVDGVMRAVLQRGEQPEILLTCIEHEEMHQETLVYILHQLPPERKRSPASMPRAADTPKPMASPSGRKSLVALPGGAVRVGAGIGEIPFGWDNEFPAMDVTVQPFHMESHKVTNGEFLAFVEAGGYAKAQWWSPAGWRDIQERGQSHPPFWIAAPEGWRYRGLFEHFAIPLDWPALVSLHEAAAFARWKGMRLPTEAEFQCAAYATPLSHAGSTNDTMTPLVGNVDFQAWEPLAVHRGDAPVHPNGLVELIGNGWEWTSTPFAGYPGFQARAYYPGYSADFFDGRHYVLKGASPVTPAALIRPTYRNWYRDHYPYAYTAFRCVADN